MHADAHAIIEYPIRRWTSILAQSKLLETRSRSAPWRETYDALAGKVVKFGAGANASANNSYVNLQRNRNKFAIVQISSAEQCLDPFKLSLVLVGGFVNVFLAVVLHGLLFRYEKPCRFATGMANPDSVYACVDSTFAAHAAVLAIQAA
jgi:hypothetical protein